MIRNRKKALPALIILLLLAGGVQAQQTIRLSLEEAIQMAKERSPDALVAQTRYRGSYWRYRYYKADYLPSLSAQTTLPDLNRSISRITLPDGSDAFIYRRLANSSLMLNLSQQIGPTGAAVYASTGISRIDIFNNPTRTSYLSTPVSVGLVQPLFSFNRLKWQSKIEPLYFREARLQYSAEMEDLTIKTINMYFDVLKTQQNLAMAQLDKANSDTLFKIAQERYKMGRIAENDLLQHELGLLNADLAGKQAAISSGSAAAKMKSFLGLFAADSLALDLPGPPDSMHVDIQKAWQVARNNSGLSIAFARRKLEAERNVAQARGENGLQGNLQGEFGLNKSAPVLSEAYSNPQDQERLLFTLQVPILNWGKSKGAVELARAQQQLAETTIRQELTDFEQTVTLQALQFNLQNSQLESARKANDVGQRRFYIARQRFLLGKIDITDLNIAQSDRDGAQRAYIDFLRSAWLSYYQLRKITLYDFKQDVPLTEIYKPEL